MKLLFALPEYVQQSGGGIIAFYRAFLPELVALGHTVHVIVGSGASADANGKFFTADGVTVEALDASRFQRWFPKFSRYEMFPRLQAHLAAAWAVWEQAGAGRDFDVVEATDWGLLYVPWAVHAALDGPPVVASMHGSMGQIATHDPVPGEEAMNALIRLIEIESLRSAPLVQANSPLNAAFWEAELGRPVDMIYPAWLTADSPMESAARGQRALVVGRIQSWKGPETLCEAIDLLGSTAPHVDWVGRDTRQGRLPAMSSVVEARFPEIWGKRVCPLGGRSPAETAALQRSASFVIVPSNWDVFNMACVEAMACATPVICSTGAGAHALIRDGANGLVFESGNAASLAASLQRMQGMSQQEHSVMGALAAETVRTWLAPKEIAAERLAAYGQLITREVGEKYSCSETLREIVTAQPDSVNKRPMEFLDTFSIRALSRHLARRLGRKLSLRM